ncbi:MAG: MTH938/NDUFAF3 family protein [Thermodesulfovibrionales bacterium]|nr:MTH938/NDUFAF3 family protein [Thermodesulfovibrionales bacterium]
MKIKDYSFGKLMFEDKIYTADLIITSDFVISPWWRNEGHLLQLKDLEKVIDLKKDTFIIGTGYFGRMRVCKELIRTLKEKIKFIHIKNTPDAIELINSLSDREFKKTVACLHLTC